MRSVAKDRAEVREPFWELLHLLHLLHPSPATPYPRPRRLRHPAARLKPRFGPLPRSERIGRAPTAWWPPNRNPPRRCGMGFLCLAEVMGGDGQT
jgi:hypothetical protein